MTGDKKLALREGEAVPEIVEHEDLSGESPSPSLLPSSGTHLLSVAVRPRERAPIEQLIETEGTRRYEIRDRSGDFKIFTSVELSQSELSELSSTLKNNRWSCVAERRNKGDYSIYCYRTAGHAGRHIGLRTAGGRSSRVGFDESKFYAHAFWEE